MELSSKRREGWYRSLFSFSKALPDDLEVQRKRRKEERRREEKEEKEEEEEEETHQHCRSSSVSRGLFGWGAGAIEGGIFWRILL